MNELIETTSDWTKEFQVDDRGRVTGSRKGAARLAGIDPRAIARLVKSLKKEGGTKTLSEPLQPFAGQDFEGGDLPDLLISAIVAHYAFKGIKEAQRSLLLMNAIGMRTYLQQQLGWQQPPAAIPQTSTQLLLPEISQHNLARKLVNEQAFKSGLQHQILYRQAYAELDYLYGYNINHKKITTSKLDRIEQDGYLPQLIAIMQKLWS